MNWQVVQSSVSLQTFAETQMNRKALRAASVLELCPHLNTNS